MKNLVTFKTAVLAKEKGYKKGTKKVFMQFKTDYLYDNNLNSPNSFKTGEIREEFRAFTINGEGVEDEDVDYFERPTQSELQAWLLDNHGLFVNVDLAYNKWGRFAGNIQKVSKDGETAIIALDGFTIFNNQFDAMEEALEEALKLLP